MLPLIAATDNTNNSE